MILMDFDISAYHFNFILKNIVWLILSKKIFVFLGRGGGRKRNVMCEGNVDRLPLAHPQLVTLSHHPGTCPDWESNWQPLGSQAGTQSTEPYQPALFNTFLKMTPFLMSIYFKKDAYCFGK